MHDDTSTTYRRTALKLAGAGLTLAGFSGTGAAQPGNSQGQGRGRGNSPNNQEDEQEQNPGQGRGEWCCSCGWGRTQGPGYRRGYPHEDDETQWDGWQPGDGRPPWARGDGEDEDEDESEEPEEPEQPENPDEGDQPPETPPDEGDQDPEDPPEEEPDEGDNSDSDDDDAENGDDSGGDGGDTGDGDDSDETDDDSGTDDGTGDDPDSGNGDNTDNGDGSGDDSGTGDDDTDDSEDEPSDLVTQVEERVHALTNEYRGEQDAPALDQSDELAEVARAHSEDMAANDYFSHDSQDGSGPGDRLDAAGIECNGWAENLAWEESANVSDGEAESIANSALEGWIDSEGHRQNLLGNYDEEGIGVAVREDEVYITQVFCSN